MFKILYVDHARALGGAEYSLLLLLKHLDRRAFIPFLACREGPLAQEARALGIQVEIVPLERLRGVHNPFLLLGCYWKGVSSLRALIERERVDLIHSNVMRASLYAAAAAKLTRVPFLWHVRDIHIERGYAWLMCRVATRVIAVSQAVTDHLPCSSKVEVVPNGLELEIYDPHLEGVTLRQELGLASDVPLVGMVGRIRPWKGQTLFLKTASRVASQNPQVRFLVVGETIFPGQRDYLEELKIWTQKLGLGQRVIFTGYRQDIPQILASLDILVHCSQAEPFGRVLIEGMAMAKPIVAFADGAVPEIVKDGETGLLVPPGDVRALAQAILSLLGNGEERREMGQRGRERVKASFDVRPLTRRTEEIYRLLLRS